MREISWPVTRPGIISTGKQPAEGSRAPQKFDENQNAFGK